MKKTFSINLGGRPFIIDEDAYRFLEDYLFQIRIRLENPGDIAGIEQRLGEMLSETNLQVIDLPAVKNLTDRFGSPLQFGDPKNGSKGAFASNHSDGTPRRLFRSRYDRVIAGVCGGIAQYFHIDPVLVRLLALISLFFIGGGLIAYLILWIVIPQEPRAKKA